MLWSKKRHVITSAPSSVTKPEACAEPSPALPGDATPAAGASEPPTPDPPAAPEQSSSKARELVNQRGKKLNLVDNGVLGHSIGEAVLRALAEHAPELDQDVGQAIAGDSRTFLVELLKGRARSIRGLPEKAFLKKVQASRDKIVQEREAAQAQLVELLRELEGKRGDLSVKEQMLATESAAASEIQNKIVAEQIQEVFRQCGGDLGDVEGLQKKVTQLTLASLAGERQKTIDAQVSEHQRDVDNFERRIAKLTESLAMTEEEMRRVASAKGIEIGVASIYRSVQGLGGDDANFEKKKELMSDIFQSNLDLKAAIESALPGE